MVKETLVDLTLEDRNGEMHVLLDPGGDHIVTKIKLEKTGNEVEVHIPAESWAWDRAVLRASRAKVFL